MYNLNKHLSNLYSIGVTECKTLKEADRLQEDLLNAGIDSNKHSAYCTYTITVNRPSQIAKLL